MTKRQSVFERTVAFLLVLMLSGCTLPLESATPTPACPPDGCATPSLPPTAQVVTPTSIFPQTPETEMPTETGTPTLTDTPAQTATSGDASQTPEVVESETPFLPTGMAELTSTATPDISPTPGFTPSPTPIVSDKLYILQEGTPQQTQNFVHSASGCQWMGVAGQVFGAGGVPMKNMVVVVSGELEGSLVDMVALTGMETGYGPGGYEIELGTKALASTGALSIQIFDLAGAELSDPYPFDTSADCSKNLVIINFVPNS